MAGLFAAGGTGEGFSLARPKPIASCGRPSTRWTSGYPRSPPATGGTAGAVAQARAAQEAGAAGILLLPPYLTEAPQQGLLEHISAACRATDLGVIVHSRTNAVLDDTTVAAAADRTRT